MHSTFNLQLSTLAGLLALLVATAFAGEPTQLAIPPGEVTEFDAPLGADLRAFAATDRKPSEFTFARCAVAVPPGFAPDRPWPVLLVSATSDPGYNSSRALLRQFAAPALRAGWVVIAADAPRDLPASADTDTLRYALLAGALTRLRAEWPGLAAWPRAFGGFSGGAKRSATLAAFSTLLGHPPIGVYQAGCNQAVLRLVVDLPGLPRAAFLRTPVYLSSGTGDRIAPPDIVDDVAGELRHAGFTRLKLAHFEGGHEVHPDHLEEALRWFAGENAKDQIPKSK